MRTLRFFLSAFILSLLMVSCSENKFDVPVDDVKLELSVYRFDTALYACKNQSYKGGVGALQQQFAPFFDLYMGKIISVGLPEEKQFMVGLNAFFQYPLFDSLNMEVKKCFRNDELKSGLLNGFKHYRFYFGDGKIPAIYMFVAGVNQSIVIDEGMIGVGLDKYLGANCVLYDRLLGLDDYKRANMYPGKLLPDVFYAFGQDAFAYNFTDDNLLGHLIHEGRLLYFVHCMLPNVNDTDLFGYKENQLLFCADNESKMWNYMIDNKLLFDTDYMNIKHFTGDGPFTSAFSKESPPRAGSWIGYQIVKHYMDRNESVSLAQLMAEKDYQHILNKSKYKP